MRESGDASPHSKPEAENVGQKLDGKIKLLKWFFYAQEL